MGYKVFKTVFVSGESVYASNGPGSWTEPYPGKWMSLPALQTAMRRAGVNVFVNEYSDKYVTVSAKVIGLM